MDAAAALGTLDQSGDGVLGPEELRPDTGRGGREGRGFPGERGERGERGGRRGPEVRKLEIAERLRAAHRLGGEVKDFRVEEMQASLSFKGAGYAADVFVDRETGAYGVTETRMGWGAIVNDLHKGRDSGEVWKAIIDISAGLMCLVSLTGLLLIFFLQKKRFSGLMAFAIGAAVCYAAYAVWVP